MTAPEIGPGLGVLVPEGACVDSWRVWDYRGIGSGCPVLHTVQVWQVGEHPSDGWHVWRWNHWLPYWDLPDRLSGLHRDLDAARKRAKVVVRMLGGRRWDDLYVISCDEGAINPKDVQHWERHDVDPYPPWLESWPGPQNWRAQLKTVAGVGTILS